MSDGGCAGCGAPLVPPCAYPSDENGNRYCDDCTGAAYSVNSSGM